MTRLADVLLMAALCAATCCAAEERVCYSWRFEDGKTEVWRWKNNAVVSTQDDDARRSKVYQLKSGYAPFDFTWTTAAFTDRDFTQTQWIDFWIRGDGSKSTVTFALGKTPKGQRSVYYQNTADAVQLDFTGWQKRRAWLHRFATPRGRKRAADLRAMNFLQFMIRRNGAKSVDIALDDICIGAGGELPKDLTLWEAEYARMESDSVAKDGSNLLPNPGFELHNDTSPHFWGLATNWRAEAQIDTGEAHAGKASVRLTCPEKRQSAQCSANRSFLPGRYVVSGWYRTAGVPKVRRAGARIEVRYRDPDGKLCGMIEIDLPPSEGQWTRFERSIAAPWNVVAGTLTLKAHAVAGTVWWDDVSLAWDVDAARAKAKQLEESDNMLGKAVMGVERCNKALKTLDGLQPADDAERKAIALAKTAFQWSIDDAERAINAKMSNEARLDLEETLERIKDSKPIIRQVAQAIRDARPTAPVVDGNPYIQAMDHHVSKLKPVEKLRKRNTFIKTAPWPKGLDGFKSIPGAWSFRSLGSRSFVYAWALTRPECKSFANDTLLPRIFCLLDAILSNHTDGEWIMGRSVPHHYDTNIQRFTLGPTLDAYLMMRERFPSLIPPRKKDFWEEQIALCVKRQYNTYGADTTEEGGGGAGDYPNMDVYYLYIMELAAKILDEPKYHEDSEKFMRFLQRKIYPMGATAYHGCQNECPCYHDLIVCIMGRYYELTKSTPAANILNAMKPYYPLNTEPGGVPEYYTDCWWKHYWAMTPCYGPEVIAGFTGDGQNKYLADEIRTIHKVGATHQYTPMAASWYRTDIPPVKPPDDFVIYDLNILGPHGRYGDFSFAGTIRKGQPGEHGRDTFVGAMLVDLKDLGHRDSALEVVTTEVRYKVSDNRRRDARFVSGDEKSWVTIAPDCGGLSTDYAVTQPTWGLRSSAIPWRGRQVWFLGRRRLIGLLTMEPTEDQEMAAVRGRIRLGLKKRPKNPERLKRIDGTSFQYGKMNVRLHAHSYARIFSEPSETFYVDTPDRFRSTEIVLADPQSEAAQGKPVVYKKGTRYHFLVEVFPYSSKPAASVEHIAAGDIEGFRFRDENGEFAVLHNIGSADAKYELAVDARNGAMLRVYHDSEGGKRECQIRQGKARVPVGPQKHALCVTK